MTLTADPEKVAEQLLEIVPRLARLISAAAQARCTPSAMTMTQLRILGLLKRERRLPSELARELKITPATTSESIDVLVRRGLVERHDHPQDRRFTILSITDDGLTQLDVARDRSMAFLCNLVGQLDASQLEALETALKPLSDLLSQAKTTVGRSAHAD